jgi:hypothetical protein
LTFSKEQVLPLKRVASLAKVFMVHKKLSFSATHFRINGKKRGAVG